MVAPFEEFPKTLKVVLLKVTDAQKTKNYSA
jgi:hypothetical protein